MARSGHGDPPPPLPASADSAPAIFVRAFPMAARERFGAHRHDEHQLACASSGILVIESGDGVWVLPTGRALWIPAGVEHAVQAPLSSTMDGVYLPVAGCPVSWSAPTVIAMSPLLRELIAYLPTVSGQPVRRSHAEALVFDLLGAVEPSRLAMPLPADPRARRVADGILTAPADPRTIGQWGRAVGASGRTLARIFQQQTGMTFGRWRTEARLGAAVRLLADGAPVTATARRVGYASPSAFVAAFRSAIGTTPGRYLAEHGSEHRSTASGSAGSDT